MAYRDGELTARQAAKTAEHVEQCPRCHGQLGEVEIEARRLQAAVEEPPLETHQLARGLEKLTARVRLWELAQQEAGRPIRELVTSQVRVFFGSCAAASVGKALSEQPEGRGALSTAKTLFTVFLGERAAWLVASRVLEGVEPPA